MPPQLHEKMKLREYLFKLIFIRVKLTYNIVLDSAVQQMESTIHMHEVYLLRP